MLTLTTGESLDVSAFGKPETCRDGEAVIGAIAVIREIEEDLTVVRWTDECRLPAFESKLAKVLICRRNFGIWCIEV